jgi:SHAQKYF class myb-like DNA-binding protein
LFLTGLEQFGKGHWKKISRELLTTRTPQQVASHAQKFFKQQQASEVEDTSVHLPQSLKRPSTGSVAAPAKKTKPVIDDSARSPPSNHPFTFGDMVWARVGKSDWWPGTIRDVCEDGKYTVHYYKPFDRTTQPIPHKNIELYSESDEKHLKKRCSRRPHSNLFNETVANARRAFKRHST